MKKTLEKYVSFNPKDVIKKRKPLSDEARAKLAENLKKAREMKKRS